MYLVHLKNRLEKYIGDLGRVKERRRKKGIDLMGLCCGQLGSLPRTPSEELCRTGHLSCVEQSSTCSNLPLAKTTLWTPTPSFMNSGSFLLESHNAEGIKQNTYGRTELGFCTQNILWQQKAIQKSSSDHLVELFLCWLLFKGRTH